MHLDNICACIIHSVFFFLNYEINCMNLKHLAYFLFLINYQYRYESTCTHQINDYSKNIPSSSKSSKIYHTEI